MSAIHPPRNRYEAANLAAKALPGGHLEPGAVVIPCLGSALHEARVLRAYFARKLSRKPSGKKGGKPRLELQRRAFAYPGNTVTLVVETSEMRGAEIEVRLFSAAGGAAIEAGAIGCCSGDAQRSVFKGIVGAVAQQKVCANAAGCADFALIDVELRQEDPAVLQRWSSLLHTHPEKHALLYLNVQAPAAGPVVYCNEDDALPETSTAEGVFLNRAGAHFRFSACICNRDLRAEELAAMRSRLAESENIAVSPLFGMENCPLPAADRTPQRLLEELNRVFSVYGINTCVRRLHFLAQIYHESARFGTTLEGASGDGYEPGVHRDAIPNGNTEKGDGRRYKGRGIIQLTWRNQQKKYLKYALRTCPDFLPSLPLNMLVDRSFRYTESYLYLTTTIDEKGVTHRTRAVDEVKVDGASLIAAHLHLAMDSAGWFWSNTDNSNPMGCHMNELTDLDSVIEASRGTNGRVRVTMIRGLKERIRYTEQLRYFFAHKFCQTFTNR